MNAIIIPANRRTVSESAGSLPNMAGTLNGWMRPLKVGIVTKTQENFQVKESVRNFESAGVIQPFSPRQLAIKPEGERSWKWVMLHCVASLKMTTDDAPIINGVRYRVMGVFPYGDYGFLQYELVQDYQPPNLSPTNPHA